MSGARRSIEAPTPPENHTIPQIRRTDTDPPPDHQAFMESRNAGLKALRKIIDLRRKKK